MDEETIGANAGKVWQVLDIKGKATRYQLINETRLQAPEIDAAIGWLSRENKIHRDGEFFSLGKTNIHKSIAMNAQIVFQVLKKLPYSLSTLHNITDLNTTEIHQAIGWLTREGNINLTSEPVVSDILDEQEKTMQYLRDETEILQQDIENRNMIISQLSKQLIDQQTQSMQHAHISDTLHDQIGKKDAIIALRSLDLTEKDTQISFLQEEITDLHNEIISRNQIITDLSKQLTTTQLESIKQNSAYEVLQNKFLKNNDHVEPTTQTNIQQRLAHVSSIQHTIESEQETSSIIDEESRLYNTTTPVLDMHKTQPVEPSVIQPRSIDEIHKTVDQVIQDRMDKIKIR